MDKGSGCGITRPGEACAPLWTEVPQDWCGYQLPDPLVRARAPLAVRSRAADTIVCETRTWCVTNKNKKSTTWS